MTTINPDCSKLKQLGQDKAGKVRKDRIRGKDHNDRKKTTLHEERGPYPDWQTTLVSGGEPAQDKKKKLKMGKLE